mgnify:CR=1 FL=1
MSFDVTILGAGAAVPTLSRGTTAQFVNCHQRHILIDCGEATQLQFRKFKVKFQKLDIILISHLHGDHVFGLPGLISTMQLLGRDQPLRIIGPQNIKKFLTQQFEHVGIYRGFPIEFVEIEPNYSGTVFQDNCLSIDTFPLNHRIQTQGYKISEKQGKRRLNKAAFENENVSVAYINKLLEGEDIEDNDGKIVESDAVTYPPNPIKTYAFCSDTAFDASVIPYIKDSDLLYHEATFIDKEAERASKTFHSTAKQAATIALKANVKRLILGHFSARYRDTAQHIEEASAIFEPVFCPDDGERFIL